MSRPLSERVKDWRYWVIDQGGHLILGCAIACAFSDFGGWGAWGFSTFLGVLREIVQNVRIRGRRIVWDGSMGDAAVDVFAWTLGASLASLIS